MKRTIFYLYGLFAVLMLAIASCGDDSPTNGTEEPDSVKPGEGEILFGEEQTVDASAKELQLVFAATQDWNMSTSTSWMTLSSKNGGSGKQTLTVSIDAYTDVYKERSGVITLQFKDNTVKTMKITQSPIGKQIKMSESAVTFKYDRYALEFSEIVKIVSNFEWKIKSYPTWIEEPVLDGTISTNMTDSTGITIKLINDKLSIEALEDSIVFSDPKDETNATVAKINLKFSGMGLLSITWERDAFQRTDLSEDLAEGIIFKETIGGNDGVKYKNDNYTVTQSSGYPKVVDYLDFYIKTPKKFAYSTIEEAQQYFDVFVLCASEDIAYPKNVEAPVKLELANSTQNDANPDYVRTYWRLSFTETNTNCLRQKYLIYVLPKGERERLFNQDGIFNKADYEYEGKLFSRRGGIIPDPTFRIEGLTPDVSYQTMIELPGGITVEDKITGDGAYIGKGKAATIEVYANDPYVLSQSRITLENGNSIESINWLQTSWIQDEKDAKHVTIKLSYKSIEGGSEYVQLKIIFDGDAYSGSNELKIKDKILIVRQ